MSSRWNPKTIGAVRAVAVSFLAFAVLGCEGSASQPANISISEPPSTSPAPIAAPTRPDGTVAPAELTGAIKYRVLNEFPHDAGAFTQGLEIVEDRLLESTGRTGKSERREVELASGQVLKSKPLDSAFFGEGITERKGLLYQLTWRANLLIISDAATLVATGETFAYEGEGWGLCATDALPGQPFVMSNGSSTLTVRDPLSFAVTRTVEVLDGSGTPVQNLNELECIGDQVLANVWQSDLIVAIDLASGSVEGVLDLEELGPEDAEPGRAVLNGIAYRPQTGTYLVTGKLWPTLYELELSSG